MPVLEIPDEYQDGLVIVINLSDQSFQELVSALEETPLALDHTTVASNVASKITTIPEDDVEKIIEVLVALNIVRSSADVTTSEFIDDLSDGLDRSDNPRVKIIGERRDTFKGRLSLLLDSKPLEVVSKVRAIQTEYDRRYCGARILTDIRPVFDSSLEVKPMAAVVMHTLRIRYHQDTDLKEFYVVLKGEDLEELKDSIERAGKKADSLKSVLDSASVSYLE